MPDPPAEPNSGIASPLHSGHHRRGVGEPDVRRMRRHILTLLGVGAALGVALLYRFPSGFGTTVLRSEKTFDAQLMNSINRIARAKSEWAAWDSKPALHTPSMGDLHPYLGAATNSIQQLESWGVRYTLTPRTAGDVGHRDVDTRHLLPGRHCALLSYSDHLQHGWWLAPSEQFPNPSVGQS